MDRYDNLTYAELRSEVSQRRIKLSGRKTNENLLRALRRHDNQVGGAADAAGERSDSDEEAQEDMDPVSINEGRDGQHEGGLVDDAAVPQSGGYRARVSRPC